jgi:hypothetical protein
MEDEEGINTITIKTFFPRYFQHMQKVLDKKVKLIYSNIRNYEKIYIWSSGRHM